MKNKKRQYRSNQGRSPEKENQIFNVLKTILLVSLCFIVLLTLLKILS